MTDLVVTRDDAGVAVITINRPERRNAMSLAMWGALGDLFNELGNDREVRAVILTGAEGGFCAGADISEFEAVRATVEDGRRYEAVVDACEHAIIECPKPTIAAVSGAAYGGGCALAVCCDFRVADASAYFGIPAARLSNVYGVTETRAVVEAVGVTAAREILFTGRRYDVDEAHRIGLVTHRAEDAAIDGALSLAASMAGSAPLTIKGAKLVIQAIARGEVGERKSEIAAVMDEAVASADYREGVAAFAEKRDPKFTGE